MINFLLNAAEIIIMSSIVILAVFLIRKLFAKRLSLWILSVLWMIVLARLIIPVTFNSPINISTLFVPETADTVEMSNSNTDNATGADNGFSVDNYILENGEAATNQDTVSAENNSSNTDNEEINIIERAEPIAVKDSVSGLLDSNIFWITVAFVWLSGAWIVLLINAYSIYNFRRNIAQSVELDDKAVQENLLRAKAHLGIKRNVKVYESRFIDSPVICGMINPKILLPKGFWSSISSSKMYLILFHELSHVKNRDIIKNYLWLAARIVHWFNPLVAIAYKEYLNDIEYISDNTVLKALNGQSPIEYTESLLDAVKLSKNFIKVPVALSFCKSKSALRKRVEIMLKPQKKSKIISAAVLMLCAVIVIACFTTACTGKDNIEQANAAVNAAAESEAAETEMSAETRTSDAAELLQVTSEAARQPLKRDIVGSEETAIEIVKAVNERLGIPNDDNYIYQGLYDRGVIPVHNIMAGGDRFGDYHIYDFNGEIRMLQTSYFLTAELGEELPLEELEQIVVDFAAKLYPDTVLKIYSCIKDDFSWETDGVEYESKDYIVTGELYDNADGSTRSFEAKIRLDGIVRYVNAEYNGMDYLGLSDDIRNKVLSYAESGDAEIDIYNVEEYQEDRLLHFTLGYGKGYVTLLESDISLVDLCIAENEEDIPYQLDSTDERTLTQEYADIYFPGNEYVTIKEDSIILDDYVGEGSITFSNGTVYFYIVLDGDGKLHKIGIEPIIDAAVPTEKIEESAALQAAIDTLIYDCPFVEQSRLEILSAEEYKDEYMETFEFEFRYTSENPTIYDYSLNAEIHIDVYTGEYRRCHITYIADGLDLITQEEAIEKAKDYIVAEYDVDPDKLIFRDFYVLIGRVLEFQANFDYENGNSYGASMLADTGERDGITLGGN